MKTRAPGSTSQPQPAPTGPRAPVPATQPASLPAAFDLSRIAIHRVAPQQSHAEREADRFGAAIAPARAPSWSSQLAQRAEQTSGTELPQEARSYFEPRLGGSLAGVRVHADARASAAADLFDARAVTLGRDIYAGRGELKGDRGTGLLAHELVHARQQAAVPSTQMVYRSPRGAELPSPSARDRILEIFNPQQSTGSTPAVDDAAAFKADLEVVGEHQRAARITGAQDVQGSSVVLGPGDLSDVTTIAAAEVKKFADPFVPASTVDAVRAKIKYIPTDPGTSPSADEFALTTEQLDSLDTSAARIAVASSDEGQQVIRDHHVLVGSRDQDLFEDALEAIVAANPADWRTIALSFRGWDNPALTMVQKRIVPLSGESDADAVRRGRWLNLGTSIHEMLHAITHRDFDRAIRDLEENDLGIEGFTEFFTRRIYGGLVERAAGDDVLRGQIEAAPGATAITPPPRQSYNDYFATVTGIFQDELGGNLENMRQAYLGGHLEYIGLGPWNAVLNSKRAHEIGAAVLLRGTGGSLDPTQSAVRISYGYLLWGHNGRVQIDLRGGAAFSYLTEGSRLALGPQASLSVSGAHVFVRGGANLEGSIGLGGALSPRLDTLLHLEAGAVIGRFHVGPQLEVLIPVTDTAVADRGVRVFAGLGASFVIGR